MSFCYDTESMPHVNQNGKLEIRLKFALRQGAATNATPSVCIFCAAIRQTNPFNPDDQTIIIE